MGTANPGFKTTFFKTGDPVSMTDEATTELSGTTFQITNANKRILDPSASFVIDVDSVPASSSSFTIDYLFGVIVFDTSQTGSVVTVTGDYLPYYEVTEGYSFSYSRTYEELDSVTFENTGETINLGLQGVSGDFETLADKTTPLDGTGGTEDSIQDIFGEGRSTVVSVEPNEGSIVHRAWVKVVETEVNTTPDGREEYSFSYMGDRQSATTADQSPKLWSSDVLY